MPPGRTEPNDALSSDIFHPSISGDWPQSNQRIHRITPDLDASRVYNQLGGPDSDDHLRVMMQTRVAVRDKTPHRFQIVPLREVTNLGPNQTARSNRLNIPTTPMNIFHDSPSGKRAPCSKTRSLQSLSHIRSLDPYDEGHEIRKPVAPESIYLGSPQETDIAHRSAGLHSRKALVELDLNRDTRVSTATTKPLLKPFGSKSITMRSLPPFSRETSISQPTSRASTGNHSPHDMKPNNLTTLGTHISEISRLFSNENVTSLPPMRRNRSMTGSSMRSDTSVGMSGTSQEMEARLKRRHAIYRESSCMPHPGKSQGKNTLDNVSIGAYRDLANGIVDTKVDKGIIFNQDTGSAGLAHLKPRFELKQHNFAGRPKIQYVPNLGASGLLPVRALKLSKNIDKHVSRHMPANCGEIAYPQIVLDLLRDIDEEIAQWLG